MTPDQERDELNQLLLSPGWAIFVAATSQEWNSPDLLERLESVLDDEDGKSDDRCARILAGRRAVHRLMTWPARRIEQLGRPQAVPRRRRA